MALQENAAAFFIKLSQEDKKYLEEIFAPGKVQLNPHVHCMFQYPYGVCMKLCSLCICSRSVEITELNILLCTGTSEVRHHC